MSRLTGQILPARRWMRVLLFAGLMFVTFSLGGGAFHVYRGVSKKAPKFRGLRHTIDQPFSTACADPDTSQPRANATLVMLARNSDISGATLSVSSIERHFNRWFHYPYTFVNNEEFDETFKETIRKYISGPAEFITIPEEDWEFPSNIEEDWIQESLDEQGDASIMYGSQKSYHQMCRYFSGKFYKHPAIQKYEWYWRVEPDIQYFCDITYDVFREMENHGKVYGYNAFIGELKATVESLYRHTQSFKRKFGIAETDIWVSISNCESYGFDKPDPIIYDEEGSPLPPKYRVTEYMDGCAYNLCHFWSNFEIARVDLWDNPVYNAYFEHLDKAGGFWHERWGDAPVHTLGVAMMLNASQIHYFRDIGYAHTNIGHCPGNAPNQIPLSNYGAYNEYDEYWNQIDPEHPNGVGCRCRCPKISEIENNDCFKAAWINLFGGFSEDQTNVYG